MLFCCYSLTLDCRKFSRCHALTGPPPLSYDFYVSVHPHSIQQQLLENGTGYVVLNEISSTDFNLTIENFALHTTTLPNADGSTRSGQYLFDGEIVEDSETDIPLTDLVFRLSDYSIDTTKVFSIQTITKLTNFTISGHRGKYFPGFRIQLGSQILHEDTLTASISEDVFTRTINLSTH